MQQRYTQVEKTLKRAYVRFCFESQCTWLNTEIQNYRDKLLCIPVFWMFIKTLSVFLPVQHESKVSGLPAAATQAFMLFWVYGLNESLLMHDQSQLTLHCEIKWGEYLWPKQIRLLLHFVLISSSSMVLEGYFQRGHSNSQLIHIQIHNNTKGGSVEIQAPLGFTPLVLNHQWL